jgi:hypothetical protein
LDASTQLANALNLEAARATGEAKADAAAVAETAALHGMLDDATSEMVRLSAELKQSEANLAAVTLQVQEAREGREGAAREVAKHLEEEKERERVHEEVPS